MSPGIISVAGVERDISISSYVYLPEPATQSQIAIAVKLSIATSFGPMYKSLITDDDHQHQVCFSFKKMYCFISSFLCLIFFSVFGTLQSGHRNQSKCYPRPLQLCLWVYVFRTLLLTAPW